MAQPSRPGRRLAAPAPQTLASKAPVRKALPFARWSKVFLSELAATSNVSAAARKAGVATTTAYDARRADAAFYRRWQEALCEGYDHLEMTLLQRLREGEIKPAAGAKRGTRQFDNGTALRLLVAHRETVARQRAVRSNEDAATVVLTINAKLEKMRCRMLADNGSAVMTGPESGVVIDG